LVPLGKITLFRGKRLCAPTTCMQTDADWGSLRTKQAKCIGRPLKIHNGRKATSNTLERLGSRSEIERASSPTTEPSAMDDEGADSSKKSRETGGDNMAIKTGPLFKKKSPS